LAADRTYPERGVAAEREQLLQNHFVRCLHDLREERSGRIQALLDVRLCGECSGR
jgi:hypothetical protein